MSVRFRSAHVIGGSFHSEIAHCVLSLQVDLIRAEGGAGGSEAIVVNFQRRPSEPCRCVQQIALRSHGHVHLLNVLFSHFRRKGSWKFGLHRSSSLLIDGGIHDGRQNSLDRLGVRQRTAADLFFVNVVLRDEILR
jgi:hypothetical protein